MKPTDPNKKASKKASKFKAKPTKSSKPSKTNKSLKSDASSDIKVHAIATTSGLHKRNKHHGRYDFDSLISALPSLEPSVILNPRGEKSIDFSNPISVKRLNKALLAHHYNVIEWDIPEGYLCPPIPGRADYIHRAAELLSNESKTVKHSLVRTLDIGVGANCIYPIIGATDYGWQYVGSDVDSVSVDNANNIARKNRHLSLKVECRLQTNSHSFFDNIIQPGEFYDLTTCNPPFHKSQQEAEQGTQRKIKNLNANKVKKGTFKSEDLSSKPTKSTLNFGGQKAELWCPGGEAEFIKNMAIESKQYAEQVLWFTTLISKKENVQWIQKTLEKIGALEMKTVEMSQGQKISRFVAWTFKSEAQRKQWLKLKS
ncbi:23S rRNA (adenine(1618)-N(6))-methyltransferase RlmF [Vibrio sp. ZSDE26]|uniref:Ribosomal RNA large subunit methyltransferase F n=1 Tax=Vibrio amylolyticus TaxID=2847292 RepID=A0A9X1XLS0_9VIBR|nr:23S rRNA (adenine(1618)-N(6))-methyltransferase RlmF [Vibrio amylolyticus]MCK6265139.1 23S rRNA (adenine(1618)-N(6))-methyltransferase RlmF [Vibrio amylolyticus]